MIYKHEIEPYNKFWLDCDTESLYSIVWSINKKYEVLCYCNDYVYDRLTVPAPSGIYFNEIRLNQQYDELQNKVLELVQTYRFQDSEEALAQIRQELIKGNLVRAGVDLYNWVEENSCYHTHHVEHYTMIHGYDDERDIFYVMETDNEKYREYEIEPERLAEAMAEMTTLRYHAIVMRLRACEEINQLYTIKELQKNAKKICRSIRRLFGRDFWLYTETDYRNGFYRDMTVMYILQINCRMKANRLLFEYLQMENHCGELQEIRDVCADIEKRWVGVRTNVSKLYYKDNPVERMQKQNEEIQRLLHEEYKMWKQFILVAKQLHLSERIII